MMETTKGTSHAQPVVAVFSGQLSDIQRQTDRAFTFLLMGQWAFCVVSAIVFSPHTIPASQSSAQIHVLAALGLGGLLTLFPCVVAFLAPGQRLTRMVLASAQVMFSSLIIYLTGGRIESHFHIFASLAFLAFYRDRWVFLPAMVLVLVDHLIRGAFWSESMLGVHWVAPGQVLEHAGWIAFEVMLLMWGVAQSREQLWESSRLQNSLTNERDLLERRVLERACQIESSHDFYEAIIDSLDTHICILDEDGVIIETNASWKMYAYQNGVDLATAGVGASYLSICEDEKGLCGSQAAELAAGLREIISGRRKTFVAEFPCPAKDSPRWFLIRASRVPRVRNAAAVVAHVDITSRVLAMQEVQRQKSQADVLALVAQHTDNSVVVTDDKACVEWVNAGFTRQTGRQLEEIRGIKLTELGRGPLTDLTTIRDIQIAIDKEQGFDTEIVNYTKSGRRYWAHVEIRPIRDADNNLTRFICIERDISAAKQASKTLCQAKQQAEVVAEERDQQRMLLESILLQIPTAVFWKNGEGTYLGCNETFASYTGLENASQIVGLTDHQLPWTSAQAEALCEGDVDLFQTGQGFTNVERSITDASGFTRTVLTSKTPLSDDHGRVIGVLGSFHDITELKAAESSAASLGLVIRESPNEVFIIDAETLGFVEVNQGACDNMGYSREKLCEMTPVGIMPNFERDEFELVVAPLLSSDSDRLAFETLHCRKDGTFYPVHVNLHCAVFQNRNVLVAFVTDLTEQKQLEAQLAQARKLESIGQLAAGIAHEINTPMQCVSGNVEFLMESYGKLFTVVDALSNQVYGPQAEDWKARRDELMQITEENHYEYIRKQAPIAIEEAAQATTRITSIVRAMKTMSHPGSMDKLDTDVNELVRSVVTISRSRWKYTAELELDLGEDVPMIPVLATAVSQVFINLIVNAADAIADKYGENSQQQGQIVVRTEAAQGGVNFVIEDDGIGMDDELQRRMFDPFFTTKDVGKGTGQGLSISYDAIVLKHGGRIDVQSTRGQGSCLTVFLPADRQTGYADEEFQRGPADDDVATPTSWMEIDQIPIAHANGPQP